MKKIISIHIPKTAGTTFQSILEKSYTTVSIQTTRPIFARCENNNDDIKIDIINNDIIHGHFIFNQVPYNNKNFYITWLRDPVERVISHYYYWKYKPITILHPIEYKIKYENLSIEDFSNIPCMKNVQSHFIGDNFESFDFIGITERFSESLKILNSQLSKQLIYNNIFNKRVNQSKDLIDNRTRKIILENNINDMYIYEKIRARLGL